MFGFGFRDRPRGLTRKNSCRPCVIFNRRCSMKFSLLSPILAEEMPNRRNAPHQNRHCFSLLLSFAEAKERRAWIGFYNFNSPQPLSVFSFTNWLTLQNLLFSYFLRPIYKQCICRVFRRSSTSSVRWIFIIPIIKSNDNLKSKVYFFLKKTSCVLRELGYTKNRAGNF